MKLCLTVVVLCVVPLALTLPIQTEDEPAYQTQQETLESVALGEGTGGYDGSARDKRTIGPLRQIFPNLSQLVDRKIQMITRVLFRVIGRLVLRGGLGGGGGGGDSSAGSSGSGGGSPGRRISITLPTYPPGEDDDDEDEEEADDKPTNTETTTVGSAANELSGSESQKHEVRVQFTDQEAEASENDDQQTAADGEGGADADAEELNDADDGRNKRFLPFNLGGGGSSTSGAGSGNFLFDIIRLVAGSGNTEASDEKANAPVGVANDQAAEKDDGYQAGVPGPITRLFVIANRGIANLMQDLILRLAQTSERIVNFKARLITSII